MENAKSPDIKSWLTQLRKGMAEFCALACLREGEAYGYALLQRLSEYPALTISESTLYPMLNRAASEGWVAVDLRPSPSGPPRRYYRLTPAGEARLNAMANAWHEADAALDDLLTRKKEPS